MDAPYDDEYCCAVIVNGRFARENPAGAAKVTHALLKGAKWVSLNPLAAAKLAVEKKYVAATAEINAQAIRALKYEPGVAKCKRNVREISLEMKKSGFLKSGTDPEELAKNAWLDLDGVTDEWIKGLKVEKVAGGGRCRFSLAEPLRPSSTAAPCAMIAAAWAVATNWAAASCP